MKLQPNFSWQKYQGKPEDQQQQFQYQLQQEHILVANSLNATIDDESYFTRERMTGFTWVDGRAIWTKTLATVAWTGGGTTNTIPLGINGDFFVIDLQGYVSNGSISSSTTLTLPYLDSVAANNIGMARIGTNIVLTSGGTNRSSFAGYITVYFVKV